MTGLAILAGGGLLPTQVAETAKNQGFNVFMVTFTGQAQPEVPHGVKHAQLPLGAVGKALNLLKKNNVQKIVLAGHLSKPKLFNLRPDAKGLTLLARLARHHDDALLRAVCTLLEEEGFQVVGVQDICPELLATSGTLSKTSPTSAHWQDIALGQDVLHTMGALDIGQAVVVKDKVVLGVEAVEGTEALLHRCAALRGDDSQGGVLVKLAKPHQTLQADVPTIGAQTLKTLADLGYDGVALSAGKNLILQREDVVKQANTARIFIVGLEDKDT